MTVSDEFYRHLHRIDSKYDSVPMAPVEKETNDETALYARTWVDCPDDDPDLLWCQEYANIHWLETNAKSYGDDTILDEHREDVIQCLRMGYTTFAALERQMLCSNDYIRVLLEDTKLNQMQRHYSVFGRGYILIEKSNDGMTYTWFRTLKLCAEHLYVSVSTAREYVRGRKISKELDIVVGQHWLLDGYRWENEEDMKDDTETFRIKVQNNDFIKRF